MRLTLTFQLKEETITYQYRNFLMSYLKRSFSKEYYKDFEENYLKGNNLKLFSFSVFIKDVIHQDQYLVCPDKKIVMTISSSDYSLINLLYNSLLINRKWVMNISPNNEIYLDRLSLKYLEEIKTNEIKIKMLSPLLVRVKQEGNKEFYSSIEDGSFVSDLNSNLRYLVNLWGYSAEGLEIIPVKNKKVVIPILKVRYTGTNGIFILKGKKETLNFLYKIGIGSRRSEGFGLFEVLDA